MQTYFRYVKTSVVGLKLPSVKLKDKLIISVYYV